MDQLGMQGMGSLDALDGMENDPDIEQKGSEGAADYAAQHWRFLQTLAVRNRDRCEGTGPARTALVGPSVHGDSWDERLYKMFEQNFGGSVAHTPNAGLNLTQHSNATHALINST